MGDGPDSELAAEVIRQKLARLYEAEPAAKQELAEANVAPARSRHQQFMYELGNSGKSLATIQTEWHAYYQQLADHEKHEVWQEFYDSHDTTSIKPVASYDQSHNSQTLAAHKHPLKKRTVRPKLRDVRSVKEVQDTIKHSVSAGGQLGLKHHLQSLLFGLSMGAVVVVIFLFSFFNEVVIAPFIQPSRVSASTPLIVSNDSFADVKKTEVIIPKINLEIPVNYNERSTDEPTIETDLENGIVHYPTTVAPGQTGNAAFFGHSSNNIFNKGKYKFAFVLLHTLVEGDTFYLTYGGKVYVYKVISRTVVDPSQIGVLGPVAGEAATATLITCDPPGTSLKRLIVVGRQISPDPSTNTQAAPTTATGTPIALPGNGPTLWSRMIHTAAGKAGTIIALLVATGVVIRWLYAPQRHR